jgi:SAM-dependent methyltransferase
MEAANSTARIALPYSRLASTYDQALGVPFFLGTRLAFLALVRRYSIPFRSVADIGCGTGLFARYMSRYWGVPVFEVDRSVEMLEMAARNCRGSDVTLLRQDIQCLKLPKPVDLITPNFDTVNHLLKDKDLQQTFRRIANNLNAGGYFLFDVLTTCQHLDRRRPFVRRFRSKRCRMDQWIRWQPQRQALAVLIVQRCSLCSPPDIEVHRERLYTPIEIGQALRDAGFMIRDVHDAVTLRPASACAPRILVVARRAPSPIEQEGEKAAYRSSPGRRLGTSLFIAVPENHGTRKA